MHRNVKCFMHLYAALLAGAVTQEIKHTHTPLNGIISTSVADYTRMQQRFLDLVAHSF